MLNEGYVKLYRALKEWGWYRDQNTKDVFIHLLLSANFKPNTYKGVYIDRGQLPCGRKQLSAELGISEQSIRTALNHLKSTNEITIETSPQGSIITINNYEKYQEPTSEPTNDQPTTNQRPTNDQPLSKNDKNDKNDKNRDSELKNSQIDYQGVVDLFHSVCVSLPKLRLLNDGRKKAIKAANERLKDIGGFEALFNAVEQSDFLTGRNGKWNGCGFDWILKPANMTKVIEGNFANRDKPAKPKKGRSFDLDEYEEMVRNFVPVYQRRGD